MPPTLSGIVDPNRTCKPEVSASQSPRAILKVELATVVAGASALPPVQVEAIRSAAPSAGATDRNVTRRTARTCPWAPARWVFSPSAMSVTSRWSR